MFKYVTEFSCNSSLPHELLMDILQAVPKLKEMDCSNATKITGTFTLLVSM